MTPPGACTSTASDPSYGCAAVQATVLLSQRPTAAFITFADLRDTLRYELIAQPTDTGGHTVVDIRRRQPATPDTGSLALLAITPPAPHLGTFYCVVHAVALHFAVPGAVPDTVTATWALPNQSVAQTSDCAASSASGA